MRSAWIQVEGVLAALRELRAHILYRRSACFVEGRLVFEVNTSSILSLGGTSAVLRYAGAIDYLADYSPEIEPLERHKSARTN